MALFTTVEGVPAYYCAKCFAERVEEALQDLLAELPSGMTHKDIVETAVFTNCGHVIDNTGSCGRCVKGITAFLTFVSMRTNLKGRYSKKLLKNLNATIDGFINRYGRVSPNNVKTNIHGLFIEDAAKW
jgi:hypothetical protein